MEVCCYCKHYLTIQGMGGAGACVEEHHKIGRLTAKWIAAPEYHTCDEWEDENECSCSER